VTPQGVRHLALPWTPRSILLVAGSPVTAAVATRHLAGAVGVGEGRSVPAVEITLALDVTPATWRVARTGAARWWLVPAAGGRALQVEVDGRGIPVGLAAGEEWPLEVALPE
jgi:hypothetical protein